MPSLSSRRLLIWSFLAAACLGIARWVSAAPAADSHAQEQLEHLPPVEPAQAETTFRIKPGFRIELVAAEPLVRDPVAIEFDENGAAYVIELPPYNAQARPDVKTTGTIVRLEDTTGDGRFDKRTVFADDLAYPTGLFCYDGGLFVGNAPELLYLKDADGDGRADERRVLYTGFGFDEAGEGRFNSFRWGLDNRIHLATGHVGGEVRPADQPNARPRSVRNRRVVLDPRTGALELSSGAGQHGFAFDDWGRPFVSENSDPFIYLQYDDRYTARNPLMTPPPAGISIAEKGKFTPLMRRSPIDPWRIIRTKMRVAGQYPGPTEGGQASGFFTAATGVTVYRGDAWPAEYRGNIFVGEAANNLVYRGLLKTDGLRLVSSRADADAEFLASSDTWCRPVQLANAPDGTLYVLDMYRELIETVVALPPQLLKQLDPLSGSDRGRIYRIVPEGFMQPPPVKLGSLPTANLVALLAHPNGWHRDTAARLLYERQDTAAAPALQKLLADSPSPLARLHALYVLDGLEALDAAQVLRGLADSEPRVRQHAVKLSERLGANDATVQKKLRELVDDPDAEVRFQLAFSLGYLPAELRDAALLDLLRRDGSSPLMRMAIQSSLRNGAPGVALRILADEALRRSPSGQQLLHALIQQIGRGRKAREVKLVVDALEQLDTSKAPDLPGSLVTDLLDNGRGAPAKLLLASSSGRTKDLVARVLGDARRTALDERQQPADRAAAVRRLGSGDYAYTQDALAELLDARQPQAVQQAAIGVLGLYGEPAVADLLVQKWRTLTPQPRAMTAEILCSRPAWTLRMLAAIDAGDIAVADIDPGRVALLKSHADAAIRQHAERVFAGGGTRARDKVVAAYRPALELAGDVDRGRAAFRKTCAACHQLEGVGTAVGADLKAIADRGAESILLNVLDPNREIKPQFLTYSVATDDGRSIAGIIVAETANDLTLRRPDGSSVTLSRSEIEDARSTGLSYMPEGLEAQVDLQTMADLLAYLNAVK
jgi:putative membrane-bound dehydrogenase-like protein